MFQMMNEARLYVGLQGLSLASSSYMNAVNYARERVQGPNFMSMLDKNPPAVPIIQHPDVRRQLISMKANVEGFRSILYYVGYCSDLIKVSDSAEEKERLQGIVDVLIPIAKGYVTDKAFDVCSQGVQVFGGYGFVEEYPQAQLLRDCRITMLYEGTNGIQAMDLLGRKLGMKKGKPVMDLFGEIQKIIVRAQAMTSLKDLADELERAVSRLGEVAVHMGKTAMGKDVMNAFSFAHPFMEVTGDVVMAWMLLWRAIVASEKMNGKKKDAKFYDGLLKSSRYFIEAVIPVSMGKMEALFKTSNAPMDIDEDSFSS